MNKRSWKYNEINTSYHCKCNFESCKTFGSFINLL